MLTIIKGITFEFWGKIHRVIFSIWMIILTLKVQNVTKSEVHTKWRSPHKMTKFSMRKSKARFDVAKSEVHRKCLFALLRSSQHRSVKQIDLYAELISKMIWSLWCNHIFHILSRWISVSRWMDWKSWWRQVLLLHKSIPGCNTVGGSWLVCGSWNWCHSRFYWSKCLLNRDS